MLLLSLISHPINKNLEHRLFVIFKLRITPTSPCRKQKTEGVRPLFSALSLLLFLEVAAHNDPNRIVLHCIQLPE